MAIRTSIFDIQIRGDEFNAFLKRYAQYEKSLKNMPASWKAVTEKIDGTRSSFDKLVDGMVAENIQLKLREKAQERADRLTKTTAERWSGMVRSTKTFATNIAGATTSLLKWASLTGLVSGLLGGGTLFGLDRLALGVATTRQSARGLGTTYGGLRAFESDLNRFVDPSTILGAVSTALAGNRTALFGAGLTENQMKGDTAHVAIEVLKNVKRIVDRTDERMLDFVGGALHLNELGFDAEKLRGLKRTPQSELDAQIARAIANEKRFGLDNETQKKWTDFANNLSDAGRSINATFVRGLVPLELELIKLSNSFEQAVRAFLASPVLKSAIDSLAAGFEKLAGWITGISSGDSSGTAKILSAITGAMIGARAAGPWGAAAGAIIGLGIAGASDTDPSVLAERKAAADRVAKLRKDREEGRANIFSQFGDIFNNRSPSAVEDYIKKSALAHGIDPDVALKVARSEGLNKYIGDQGTSFGPFQLHYKSNIPGFTSSGLGDEFTKYTGLDARNKNTVQQQIDFALDYAARNGWRAWHGWQGDQWSGIHRTTDVKVKIENETGANPTVSINGLKN